MRFSYTILFQKLLQTKYSLAKIDAYATENGPIFANILTNSKVVTNFATFANILTTRLSTVALLVALLVAVEARPNSHANAAALAAGP